MKKLLGISIVAVLAVTPLMANAAAVSVTVPDTITATNDVASTSYVKGAHKELGVAINSLGTKVNTLETTVGDANSGLVHDVTALDNTVNNATTGLVKKVADLESNTQAKLTEGDGINISNNTVSVDAGTGLTINSTSKALELSAETQASLGKADSALQKADVTTGTAQMADGTISVKGEAVAVKGLKSAAFAETTAFDAAGAAADVANKLDDGVNGYEIDAKSLKVQGTDVLTTASSLSGANLTAGTVAKTALAEGVQSSLGLADSALQKADIKTGTANGTIEVGGTDVAVKGLGTAAYAATTDFDAAGAAADAETAAKAWANQKLVTVHTTWGSDSTTGTVALANTPTQQ